MISFDIFSNAARRADEIPDLKKLDSFSSRLNKTNGLTGMPIAVPRGGTLRLPSRGTPRFDFL
jgi:hypothetical protein